jgi:hypothetical protein
MEMDQEKSRKLQDLLRAAWVMSYDLEKQTNGELTQIFAKINSKINSTECDLIGAIKIMKKGG